MNQNKDIDKMLEFQAIKEMLVKNALTGKAAQRFEQMEPYLDQARAEAALQETTEARKVLDALGNPPFSDTAGVREAAQDACAGVMLTPDQLECVRQFAQLSLRLTRYLGRCRDFAPGMAGFAAGFRDLTVLQEEIERCVRGGRVDDYASKTLRDIRRKKEQLQEQIHAKMESLLRSGRKYFSESFISMRNGRFTLPVKKEYKSQIPGIVVDTSSTGATLFIEPSTVSRLRGELDTVETAEENEEKIILYTLSALTGDNMDAISANLEYMEELDYIFAKGKRACFNIC